MKNNNIDIKLEWKTLLSFPSVLSRSNRFPSFNVTLKHKELIIDEFLDLNNHVIINTKSFSAQNGSKKLKYNLNEEKSFISSNFSYPFESNFKKYKENNNKIGFYKNIDLFLRKADLLQKIFKLSIKKIFSMKINNQN